MSITAIVPNYNHARFLERRLKSIYEQTCPPARVILLDDASTDGSLEILEAYRHHSLTQALVVNEANSGSPFRQWKKGLDMVETDWVWIAESDDWCEPDFLESLSPAFTEPEAVLAYAGLYWADEAGNILKPASPPETPGWYKGQDFVRDHLFRWNRLQNAGMLVFRKKSALHARSPWQKMVQAGDFALWADIAPQGRIYTAAIPLCYMTRHPQSLTTLQYHRPQAQEELIRTWLQMEAAGYIRRQDIRQKLEATIIGLFTAKRGMGMLDFRDQYQFWTGQLLRLDFPLRPLYWKGLAFKAKVAHGLKQRF